MACRLVVDGRDTTGFTLAARPPRPITCDHSEELRAAARARGRPAALRHQDRAARRLTAGAVTAEDDVLPVSVPASETGTGAVPNHQRSVRSWRRPANPDS